MTMIAPTRKSLSNPDINNRQTGPKENTKRQEQHLLLFLPVSVAIKGPVVPKKSANPGSYKLKTTAFKETK